MAKRFQPLKEFGRTTKKPRLDISTTKGRPSESVREFGFLPVSTNAATTKCSPQNDNFWDDDDDVILLATQVAESEAAVATTGITCETELTNSEITFREFEPHMHAATSTQRLVAAEMRLSDADLFSQMFNDNNDEDFALLADAVVEKNMPTVASQSNTGQNNGLEFKKPLMAASNKNSNTKLKMQNPDEATMQSTSHTQARRQLATERQMKFLMDHVDNLKKENQKLTEDLNRSKDKVQSKEGETTLLRDELRQMKRQVQQLKMEKIMSAETAKSECQTKIDELSKLVIAKQTALEMSTMEYSSKKMRYADETRRLENSMLDLTTTLQNQTIALEAEPAVEQEPPKDGPEDFMPNIMSLDALQIHDMSDAENRGFYFSTRIEQNVYEPSLERGTSKKQTTLFQRELAFLQRTLAQLQMQRNQQDYKHVNACSKNSYTEQIIESVCKVLSEFWTYVHSLEFPKNCRVHPYHDYHLLKDVSDRAKQTLTQPNELYADERAISLRRYVAILSEICRRYLPELCTALLTHQHGEYFLLKIAIDAIYKLSFAREICEHFGVLEAFATLLHSLLINFSDSNDAVNADNNEYQRKLLIELLQQLVFARPSPWIFRELSLSMLELTRLPQALELICINSNKHAFLSDRVRSLYRFTNDSCLLQVYAGLLEIAFPLNTALPIKHLELLSVICLNHVRFVYACFANPPKFLHNMLPSYDYEDEDDDKIAAVNEISNELPTSSTSVAAINDFHSSASTSSSNNPIATTSAVAIAAENAPVQMAETKIEVTCECYIKLCLSALTLIFLVLYQWIESRKLLLTPQVIEVSKISLQLLHIIFCDNYTTSSFRNSEDTIKHYLHFICRWWSDNEEILEFKDLQLNFLSKLKDSHLIPKKIVKNKEYLAQKAREVAETLTKDLMEWQRLTGGGDKSNKADVEQLSKTDASSAIKNLQLVEQLGDEEKFFEGLKGYAFNFQ